MSDTTGFVPSDRHPNLAMLDGYWTDGHAARLPVAGTPECWIELDPTHGEMKLALPADGNEPDVTKFRNIDLATFTDDGSVWWEIRVLVDDSLHEAYSLLTRVADLIQLDRQSVAMAVHTALEAYRTLLASRGALSEEQQVGLHGELLLVEHLLDSLGSEDTISAWMGPLSEEHDLAFADVHLEVKTTKGEHRRHMISGTQQLQPLRGIPLWLVSIQLTPSTPDAGRTLVNLVMSVRARAGDFRPRIDALLLAMGWRDSDADLYTRHLALRSQPRAYLVDDSFPALTDARIGDAVPHADLLSDVRYRIDVTQLEHGTPPHPISGFVETTAAGQP